ncbi:Hypothetical predicted protein [Marmota monax]|uniref:Uncharacterized protein n=1 Tax=Marmota monax TaxID=9995 RepID=A0A5E4BQZ3_MARMO|nr:hypothetical protein GHT09_017718 [Marmota monax]VTJ71401.1 Hypothetical predicted protein [Marmota monax]
MKICSNQRSGRARQVPRAPGRLRERERERDRQKEEGRRRIQGIGAGEPIRATGRCFSNSRGRNLWISKVLLKGSSFW